MILGEKASTQVKQTSSAGQGPGDTETHRRFRALCSGEGRQAGK